MKYEQKKLIVHRLIWFALLVVTIIVSINFWTNWLYEYEDWWYLFLFLDVCVPLFFIGSLLLSCKIYDYNGTKILVYAGWYHHYIKVSEVLVDEHNTILSYTPIVMSATLKNDTTLQATISLTNRISLKINGQLYL